MTTLQYTIFVADYSAEYPERAVLRLERVATKKKAHIVLEAYHERYDADVLLSVRIIDWWDLSPVPSFYIPEKTFQKLFEAESIRVDFVP